MKFTHSAVVVLAGWLLALSTAAQAADDPMKNRLIRHVRESFPILGVSLFEVPARPARGAHCRPIFDNQMSWCATAPTYETADGGTFRQSFGYNTDSDGSVVYVVMGQREYPLPRTLIDDKIAALGSRYGNAPTKLTFHGSTEDGTDLYAVIAYWGGIKLVRLSEAEYRVVAKNGSLGRGHLVDFRQDTQLSAEHRDPVFKIEGSAGFIAQFRAVTDVRTDIVLRSVYQPAFTDTPKPKREPEAQPEAKGPLPLDPPLAYALNRRKVEASRDAAAREATADAEAQARADAERKAAEAKARADARAEAQARADAERKAAEEQARADAARKAAEARAQAEAEARAEAERQAAEERAKRLAAERAQQEAEARARREEAERKIAEQQREAAERAVAQERARREKAAQDAATEEARQAEADRKAEADRQAAEQRAAAEAAKRDAADRKAQQERQAIADRAQRAEAEYRAAVARAQRAEADRKAAEDRAKQAEADRKAAEEEAQRLEAERKAAEQRRRDAAQRAAQEKAMREAAERKAAEEKAMREAAERKAAAARKAAEEKAQREAAERKAAADKLAEAARKTAAAQKAADDAKARAEAAREAARRAQAEAERKAAATRARADARRPSAPEGQLADARRLATEAPRRASEDDGQVQLRRAEELRAGREADERAKRRVLQKFSGPPDQGGPAADSGLTHEAWVRRATALARKSAIAWVFDQSRDRISDDLMLRAQAVFPAGKTLAFEVAFECNIGAGKRLKAYARAFDQTTKATMVLPVDESQSGVVRGTVTLDDGAPQTAFMFPESGARQVSIVEVPVTHEDIRKNTPRGRVWLRYYEVALQLKLRGGDVIALIHPYDEKLRRVLEACAN